VNLVLEVLRRRDDGYHELDTIFQELELADEVEVRLDGPPGIEVDGPFAKGTPADATNLAWRAALALRKRLAIAAGEPGVRLTKHIPPAGGLGGGASDAATALRLLATAWPGTSEEILHEVAATLGSDEVFFLVGGTARGTGRGECVTALPALPPHDVVLFVPPFSIERKTAQIFAALGRNALDPGGIAGHFAQANPPAVRSADLHNAFERVAFEVFPGLAPLRERIEAVTGEQVRLAGAGPTLFWIGPAGAGRQVARAAAGCPCTVILTRTAGAR
jgi:4-diphosphocytidyl-2-C-methyl-D-erythritol kinase